MLIVLGQRLLAAWTVMLIASAGSFGLVYLAPGDPALVIAAQRSGHLPQPEEVAAVAEIYGLNQPLLVQYLRWCGQILRGDLGFSIRTGEPVLNEIGYRLGPTAALAAVTLLFTLAAGIPLGILAAMHAGSWFDQVIRFGMLLGVALPSFWLGFLLVLLFAITLHWLPSFGLHGPASFILPVLTLGVAQIARISQLTRILLLDELGRGYVQTARAKGLSDYLIWWRHVLPNCMLPLLTLAALQFGSIVTGAVIVESIFAWPGLGSYFIEAVAFRDLPVIQAMAVFFAAVFIGTNLLTDSIYVICDPRIRFGAAG